MRELERDLPSAAATALRDESLPALVIVGRGRLGSALASTAAGAGLEARLAGREDAAAAASDAEAILLAVPDAAIVEACEALGEAIPPVRLVGHTSGATPLEALAAARERGAATFSLHPLQTVPGPDADLTGAPCAISGSGLEAERFASRVAERLGMRPFLVPDARRAAYHAAASIASNFLVALEESAADLLRRTGIDDARELLAPLVMRSAANWAEDGPAALTGPIARGDHSSVERHLAAIDELAPELRLLYEALAERTRALAEASDQEGPR